VACAVSRSIQTLMAVGHGMRAAYSNRQGTERCPSLCIVHLKKQSWVQTRGKSRSERLSRLTFRSCRKNTRPRYKRPRTGDDDENHKTSGTLDVRQRTTWPCSGQAEDDCPMWLNHFSMKRGKYPMIETSVHESGDAQKERLTIKLGQGRESEYSRASTFMLCT
jgi:hypothetical protein